MIDKTHTSWLKDLVTPETPESSAQTRALARFIGPFLMIASATLALRMPWGDKMVSDLFANYALVWIAGALLLLGGSAILTLPRVRISTSVVVVVLFAYGSLGSNIAVLLLFAGRESFTRRPPAAVVITLLGWLLAARGVMMMFAPELVSMHATRALKHFEWVRASFGLLALIGGWLTYVGWRSRSLEGAPAHSQSFQS